ncbi:uncharacterized protein VTP21DRAFT_10326 [Calcarisporiella thermophila]|uniref:uncharacterized protein n=1 Tax=Calcarisporiella thermophila TaxID=911321 RepID=UPI00374342C3
MFSTIQHTQHPSKRFLIVDCPDDDTIALKYLPRLQSEGVTDIVRICDQSYYDSSPLRDAGIYVHDDLKFADGEPPPEEVVEKWLALTNRVFENHGVVAVHCVSGIGRAPVLVAISLIDEGMDPYDAIEFIRKHRRGALNRKQVDYLLNRKRKRKRKSGLFLKMFKGK